MQLISQLACSLSSTGVVSASPSCCVANQQIVARPAHSQHLLHHNTDTYVEPNASKFLRFTFRGFRLKANVLHLVVVWLPCMPQAVSLRVRSQARSSKWHRDSRRPAAVHRTGSAIDLRTVTTIDFVFCSKVIHLLSLCVSAASRNKTDSLTGLGFSHIIVRETV